MNSTFSSARVKKQFGQGMTEYIIIVALIAIAAIAAFQFFGQTIRNQTAGIANEVAGKSASSSISAAQTSATNVGVEGGKKKGLDSYGGADTNASK